MPFRDAWIPVGVLLVVIGFAASEPAMAAIGFVVIVIGGVARYWARHLFDRVTFVTRLGERRAFIDERVALGITLENRKPLPLPWYEWRLSLSDELRVDGEELAAQAVPGLSALVRRGALGWYTRDEWSLQTHATVRGYHQLGPVSVRSSDLLGLFPRRADIDAREQLIVFPRVFSMEDLGLPGDRPFGERKGRDRVFEDPLRIAGTREYRPGDPLRRIDWKATARRGGLQARVYEPSATHQFHLLMNIDTLEHAWEGFLPGELERTISVAASIATWAAGARYSIGLLANGSFPGSDRPIRLPPSRSPEQLARILEALAVIQPLTLGDLAGAIGREAGRLPLGSTVVVVASLTPPPLVGAVLRLAAEGNRVAVVATSDRVRPDQFPGISYHKAGRVFEHAEAKA